MKYFSVIVLFAIGINAEPPYRGEAAEPYDPAGYRPNIPFTSGERQQFQPQATYGVPQVNYQQSQQYLPPAQRQFQSAPPRQEYLPPQQQYNPVPPQQQYLPPQQNYNRDYNPYYNVPNQQFAPNVQYLPQQQQYATPQQQFFQPPQTRYGAPENPPPEVTTQREEVTTTEVEEEASTTEATTESVKEDLVDEAEKQEGIYYIYHPSGSLQRILFMTRNDLKNMAYSAQFKYQDVDPIKDPIYTYDPQTLQLRRLSA